MSKKEKKNTLFGGGWKKPVKDENGLEWCNCIYPNLTSLRSENSRGIAWCMRCKTPYYH